MDIKKGIAASPGISIAEALVIDNEDYRIPRRSIKPSQRMAEILRVRNAFKDAVAELTELGKVFRLFTPFPGVGSTTPGLGSGLLRTP